MNSNITYNTINNNNYFQYDVCESYNQSKFLVINV